MMTINRSCLLPVEHLVPGIVPDHGVSPVREDHPDLLALVDFHPYDVETRLIYCSGLECLDEAFPGFLFGRLHLDEVHDFPVRLDRGELAVILLVLREMFRAQAVGLFVERVREWCIAPHAMSGHLQGPLRSFKFLRSSVWIVLFYELVQRLEGCIRIVFNFFERELLPCCFDNLVENCFRQFECNFFGHSFIRVFGYYYNTTGRGFLKLSSNQTT